MYKNGIPDKWKLGSLFDGSGGFPLAGTMCGIEPIWASEVEPYPIAVTKSRFPNMTHLGDVSKVNGGEIEPVDVMTFGSPCFPAGTLVLTDNGYIPIEDIKVGDMVFTHAGNWKPVVAVGSKVSNTIKLKGNHYGLITTPNHPIYSSEQFAVWNGNGYDRKLENVGEWTDAKDMQGKRWAVPNKIAGIDIPEIAANNKQQSDPPPISVDLMYILGRWLGDGWIQHGQRPNRPLGQNFGQIFICANYNKAEMLDQKMHNVFDGFSSVGRSNERTVVKFRINNQRLCNWIRENFGEGASEKTLPAWAYCMEHPLRQALLDGYLDSDGYKFKEHTWKASTVSKKLAHSIRLLGETLGYSCTVHFSKMPEKNNDRRKSR